MANSSGSPGRANSGRKKNQQQKLQNGPYTDIMLGSSKDKVDELKIQVDQVVDVMQENLKNVADRGETLESLQEKSENLQNTSLQFNKQSKSVNRALWWKNMKWNIILGTSLIIITGGLVTYFVMDANKKPADPVPPTQ